MYPDPGHIDYTRRSQLSLVPRPTLPVRGSPLIWLGDDDVKAHYRPALEWRGASGVGAVVREGRGETNDEATRVTTIPYHIIPSHHTR